MEGSHQKGIALLNEWDAFCTQQSELHEKTKRHYKRIHKMLFIPASILGSVSGVSMIATSIIETNPVLGLAFGVMSLTSALLMSLHNSFEISAKIERNGTYKDTFLSLSNEIKVNLMLDESDDKVYTSIEELVKEIKQRLEICIDKAPSIPESIGTFSEHFSEKCTKRSAEKVHKNDFQPQNIV
jgi:UV DNA damage repair endonuclease